MVTVIEASETSRSNLTGPVRPELARSGDGREEIVQERLKRHR